MTNLTDNAGIDFRVEDHIYTFEEVVFLISNEAGELLYYPLSSVDISLQLNALPTITLQVAPQSFQAADVLNADSERFIFVAQPEPIKPILADFVEEYNKLQKLILSEGAKASLSIEIQRSDGEEQQRIALTNWIPIEATITGNEGQGSFLLNITIQHPAYLSTSATGWLPNSAATLNTPETFLTEGLEPNIRDLFIDVNKSYLVKAEEAIDTIEPSAPQPQANIDCATSFEDLSLTVFDRLSASIEAFSNYTEWNPLGGTDLPLIDELEENSIDPSEFFGRLLWQIAGRQDSPWDTFISLLQEYDLVISGGPSADKLIVTPFAPWGKFSTTIFDAEIVSINMPGMGQRDVSGVLSAYNEGAQNDFSGATYYSSLDGAGGVSNPAQLNTFGGYVCPLTEDPKLLGALAYRNPPSWLGEYLQDQSGDFGPSGANNPMGRNEVNYDSVKIYDTGDAGKSSGTGGQVQNYDSMINTWCKQAFFRLFKSDNNIQLTTRLLITSPSTSTPGKFIRPGVVVKVSSVVYPDGGTPSPASAEEEPVLYFYVTRVEHTISPGRQTAATVLTGSYLRFSEAIEQANITEQDISGGIENPLYGSLGYFE